MMKNRETIIKRGEVMIKAGDLYVMSDDPIETGDFYVDTITGELHVAGKAAVTMNCFRKVIATTRKALNIPSVPKTFLVKIEYEEYMTEGWVPTYNDPDNNGLVQMAEMDIRPLLKNNAIVIR